jgi:hypothetical protein
MAYSTLRKKDVLILTEEFPFDLGICLSWRKLTVPSLWSVTDVFHLNIKLKWVFFCACEIIQLFSLVFSVVWPVHNFSIRLLIIETPNKWWLLKRSHALIDAYAFDRIYIPPPRLWLLWVVRDCSQAVEINCSLFSKGQYAKNTPEKYLLLKFNAT